MKESTELKVLKVLLVAINSQYVHSSPVPWYLKAACRSIELGDVSDECDLRIEVAEFSINDRLDRVVSDILIKKPDVLAISCYIWNYEMVCKIVPDIKKLLPNLRVVFGGPEAEHSQKPWFCDEVLTGDGEVSLPNYLSKMLKGVQTSRDPFLNDREMHLIATEDICKAGEGKIVYLETVRGCPYKCSYCLAPQTGKVRKLDMALVKQLIDRYMNSKVRQVKFVDRTFNADRPRAFKIISYIFESYKRTKDQGGNPPGSWHFEVAADLFDQETLSLVEQLPDGLVQFEAGVQSLNEQVLIDCARKTDSCKVLKTISTLVGLENCMVHADLIAGLPGEDLASFVVGFDKLHATFPHQLQLGFLKVLKGSSLATRATELGLVWSQNSPFQVLKTKEMTWDELYGLTLIEEVLERCWNNGRFTNTVKFLANGNFFEFYRFLASKIENLISQSMSASSMAVELFNISKDLGVDEETSKTIIKIDLLTACFPVKMPEILKYDLSIKNSFSKISGRAKEIFGDRRIHIEPISDHEVIVLNCEDKNPVTGKYKYFIAEIE